MYVFCQGLGDHNYCRNPDNDDSPWCWVAPGHFDFCDVPACPDVSTLDVYDEYSYDGEWDAETGAFLHIIYIPGAQNFLSSRGRFIRIIYIPSPWCFCFAFHKMPCVLYCIRCASIVVIIFFVRLALSVRYCLCIENHKISHMKPTIN